MNSKWLWGIGGLGALAVLVARSKNNAGDGDTGGGGGSGPGPGPGSGGGSGGGGSGGSPSFQPRFPIAIASYFTWYAPERWQYGGSNYTPALGKYTTADPTPHGGRTPMQWHIAWAKYAHIAAFACSWWGQQDYTDTNMQLLMREIERSTEYPNLRVCVEYDLESVGDPTVEQIVSDLEYLERTAFQSPVYLRVDGRPVIFVYSADSLHSGPATSARWKQAVARYGKPLYYGLQVYVGWENDPNQPDVRWQYPSTLHQDYSAYPKSFSVSPGFWKTGESVVTPRDPAAFEAAIQLALTQPAIWRWFSFNEWIEGSQVEPTVEDTPPSLYLDIMQRNLPAVT